MASARNIETNRIRKVALKGQTVGLEHQLDDLLGGVAGFTSSFELGKIIGPQLFLALRQLVQIIPREQSAVMTVVEGQF